MAQYRSKPVMIEAFQLEQGAQMPEWFVEAVKRRAIEPIPGASDRLNSWGDEGVAVNTLLGQQVAKLGDWVIRAAEGDLYACNAAIFDATYESVAEVQHASDCAVHNERGYARAGRCNCEATDHIRGGGEPAEAADKC